MIVLETILYFLIIFCFFTGSIMKITDDLILERIGWYLLSAGVLFTLVFLSLLLTGKFN